MWSWQEANTDYDGNFRYKIRKAYEARKYGGTAERKNSRFAADAPVNTEKYSENPAGDNKQQAAQKPQKQQNENDRMMRII